MITEAEIIAAYKEAEKLHGNSTDPVIMDRCFRTASTISGASEERVRQTMRWKWSGLAG